MLLNKEKIAELHKLEILFSLQNSEWRKINEKLIMTSQFDLTQIYDIIIYNLVF